MKKLITKILNLYLSYNNKRHFKELQGFQAKFEKQMKRLRITLAAQIDPKDSRNILLEFVNVEELNMAKKELAEHDSLDIVEGQGDKIEVNKTTHSANCDLVVCDGDCSCGASDNYLFIGKHKYNKLPDGSAGEMIE